MTTKLSDLQLILLSTAAGRPDANLLPPPETIARQDARISKAIPSLLKRGLVEEIKIADESRAWRQEGGASIGLVITAAGRETIGMDEPDSAGSTAEPSVPATGDGGAPKPGTKIATVLALLRRDGGATLGDMVEATGWLPHTTRAALTGLRKKGHGIVRGVRDDTTVYTLAA
jgi:hypothetical protein